MWTQLKNLNGLVESTVIKKQTDSVASLDAVLKKHRQDFLNLLKNPPKNTDDRNLLLKATSEPVLLPGKKNATTIEKSFFNEVQIISDMFNLNEMVAMELLLTAEQQQHFYPDLTRGLIAVLLYYDAWRALVNSLKILIQARRGISWMVNTTSEVINIITKFTDKLMDKGMVEQIVELLNSLDVEREINLLNENRALGNPKHRRQVLDFFNEIRQSLADTVFFWAAQSGLPKSDTLHLIKHLSSLEQLDGPNLTLFMAFLYAVDISSIVKMEEREDVVKMLPITSDSSFVPAVHTDLNSNGQWKKAGLQSAARLAWSVTLATFRSLSSNLCAPVQNQVDDDETILDSALNGKALTFLSDLVQNKTNIYTEEFYLRRLHSLITDLIVQMPLKIKDLRNKADEVARTIHQYQQEGLEPPNSLSMDFQSLLHFIAVLYAEDPLELELCLEFWSSDMNDVGMNYRVSQRQMALYKFIRLAGDLLPPSLYIAYADMLRSLANGKRSAHQAFTLLKQNSGTQGNLISWEHFFSSLHRYFNNLRQESLPVPDTIYRHKQLTKGITPQEVQGLQSVFRLMRTVVLHDPVARIALAENPSWMPLLVMIGLLGCAVPLNLKAEIVEVLAAFAHSPDIAQTLWNNIEVAQILATTSMTSPNVKGIQTELEDVESRAEEYPLTRAFLKLLDVLTNVPIPPTLGAGHRTPGFDPYLIYVRDSVFLKFTGRAYRNETEKWQIGNLCLKLFLKLLMNYEPSIEDFQDAYVELPSGGSVVRSKAPGYHLLIQCLHETHFLRLIFEVIDTGCKILDRYADLPGLTEVEATTLNALQLLRRVLYLQEEFFELIRRLGSSMRVITLDSLLLGTNTRTGKPDHMINVGKMVTYNQHLPQHALAALHIIRRVAAAPSTQNQLLALYTNTQIPGFKTAIRHGFIEALEMEDSTEQEELSYDHEMDVANAGYGCKLAVLHLLIEGVNLPHPSFAHYLLGFDIHSPLSKTILQQPGVQDHPRTCLHALLAMLEKNIAPHTKPTASPRVIELCYKLLYLLCSHPYVSDIILRFLRSSNFLGRQVAALPFTDAPEWLQLSQMSWLLKSVAVEVKVTGDKGLQSHISKLAAAFLLEIEDVSDSVVADVTDRSLLNVSASIVGVPETLSVKARPKIVLLLDVVNLKAVELTPPSLEFFDPSAIEQLVKQCEVRRDEGIEIVKVSLLQNRLRAELSNLTNIALGQRQMIIQEIQNILSFVAQRNNIRLEMASRKFYLEGWRQVLETLLATGSLNSLPRASHWNILTQIIQDVFNKCLSSNNNLPELVHFLSGVMVILLAGLRACALDGASESGDVSVAGMQPSDYVRCLDGTILRTPTIRSSKSNATSTTISVIQRQLVDWILRAGVSAHRVRTNLYSALLNSLRIGNHTTEFFKIADTSLLQTLIRDCSSGHDVQRMLALSLLDQLSTDENQGSIAKFLSSQGYLKHMVDSLVMLDSGLMIVLESQPNIDGMRTLYVYESQMGLLTRLASSQKGAQILLENNLFQRLSEMSIFSQRPDVNIDSIDAGTFVPSTAQRFHQIFFPALQLCSTMLTSLGSRHRVGCSEVIHFLLSHSDTVSSVLRSRSSTFPTHVEETALLTAVISRAAGWDSLADESPSAASTEILGQVSRLEQVTLNLLPTYIPSENMLPELGPLTTKLCLQVAVNILKLARSLNAQNRSLFYPSFEARTGRNLSLGTLVKILQGASALLVTAQDKFEVCKRRLDSIQDLTTQQLSELLPVDTDEKLPANARRMIGANSLHQELKNWEELSELCSLVLESATWLFWNHIEYYVQPKRGGFMGQTPVLSIEDLNRLKKEAPLYLNVVLLKKISECEQVYLQKRGRHGFVQALLRRIKRLLSM